MTFTDSALVLGSPASVLKATASASNPGASTSVSGYTALVTTRPITHCHLKMAVKRCVHVVAVRPDRMRGGRNKFGPMYKYDRALRQQALRQRQLLLAQGFHQPLNHDMPPADFLTTPPDVKPDISQLSATSRVVHEAVPAPTDVASSHGEFYRYGNDPASASAGSYPVPPSRACQDSYLPRQDHHRYSSSTMSYDYDVNVSVPFSNMTDPRVLRLTPLAGLSHMMNDVPNFVGQSAESRLQRVYPATVRPRTYTSQPSHPSNLPTSSYQLPMNRPPEELRRHSSMVPPPSSFPSVLPQSSHPFPPNHPPQSSSQAIVSAESPPSRVPLRFSRRVNDLLPNASQLSPVSTMSAMPLQASLQPSQPLSISSRCPNTLLDFISELCRNEPNQRDVQKKLSHVLQSALEEQRRRPPVISTAGVEHIPMEPCAESAHRTVADLRPASQLWHSMEFICKMCDQMLFVMVEWARGAWFFRELKVQYRAMKSSHSV